MINLKILFVGSLMMLPFVADAQSCCQSDNDVVKTIMERRSIRKYFLTSPTRHPKCLNSQKGALGTAVQRLASLF